jgi:hypothetical protein
MAEAIIGAFGVVVAAFAVWLIVRMVNRRERWTKWTAVALVVTLFLYPLSTGPVDWLFFHGYLPKPIFRSLQVVYEPFGFIIRNSPQPIRNIYSAYDMFWIQLGEPRQSPPVNPSGATPEPASESN